MTDLPARRLLLVHAHPDDETITTGATMARYAADGALVTLVTCTLGEEGEVIPPGLAHLAAGRDDALGPYRARELDAAMAELGVTDHRFLGGRGRYRDSGMMGAATNDRPGCFWQADLDEAAGHLAEVITEVRPQALVTYDAAGGYGHPDHIKAHRVALRACELAAGRGHEIARVYEIATPRSAAESGFALLSGEGVLGTGPGTPGPFAGTAAMADLPGVVDDDEVTVTVDGSAYGARKSAAMRAHATQIAVAGAAFALSNGLAQPLLTVEGYRLVRGEPLPPGADLFGDTGGRAGPGDGGGARTGAPAGRGGTPGGAA